MAKVHVHGVKRAAKVLKRKQRVARETKKSNIKQAIYAFEKALKSAEVDAAHAGHDHSHEGHDHSSHEGHDHA